MNRTAKKISLIISSVLFIFAIFGFIRKMMKKPVSKRMQKLSALCTWLLFTILTALRLKEIDRSADTAIVKDEPLEVEDF